MVLAEPHLEVSTVSAMMDGQDLTVTPALGHHALFLVKTDNAFIQGLETVLDFAAVITDGPEIAAASKLIVSSLLNFCIKIIIVSADCHGGKSCLNGGSCMRSQTASFCNCPAGWYGDWCQSSQGGIKLLKILNGLNR